jgi:hypothetical protein
MREQGRGAWAALARYLQKTPSAYRTLSGPELSMMFSTGTRGIDLDTLDDLAAFFSVPLSDILGIPNASDLSAEEQRIVHAFRVLHPTTRAHLVAIAEHLSIQVRIMESRRLPPGKKRVQGHESIPAWISASTIAGDYDDIRRLIEHFIVELNDALDRAPDAGRQATPSREAVAAPRPRHRAGGRSDAEKP